MYKNGFIKQSKANSNSNSKNMNSMNSYKVNNGLVNY
jgi:hypothetical protein